MAIIGVLLFCILLVLILGSENFLALSGWILRRIIQLGLIIAVIFGFVLLAVSA